MQDSLAALEHHKVEGGRIRNGIGLFPLHVTIRNGHRVYLSVRIENRTDKDYRVANLETIQRQSSGFLWLSAKNSETLKSQILCSKENLLIEPHTKETCVVAFDRPEKTSSKQHIGIKLSEASTRPREVYIKKILEIYE